MVLKTGRAHLIIRCLLEEVLLASKHLLRALGGWSTSLGTVGDAEEREDSERPECTRPGTGHGYFTANLMKLPGCPFHR